MGKNEIVAMILAGGQGSRLGVLTKKLAKPAVPFGGKYRIIDFPLSNCSNSGIYTVGVLTQYKPLELNAHIGIGEAWDLDRTQGGVSILPPYQEEKGGEWYKGTANAIYQNIEFVDRYDPEYILILSGDHIYKMDYTKMLDFHKEKNASLNVAVIEVPIDEASRFGIMNTDENSRIIEFEEKPEEFYKFYKDKLNSLNYKPNVTHYYLSELEKEGKLLGVITQNIDGLHQKAGSSHVIELHGSVLRNYCERCGKFYGIDAIINSKGVPKCSCGGRIKPDVLLYEEGLDEKNIQEAVRLIKEADVLIVGGTSLGVYPAAGLIDYYNGNKLVLINKSETPYDRRADLLIHDALGNVFSPI